MTKAKTKVSRPALGSYEDMEIAFGELAAATLVNESLQLDLDAQIGAVRTTFMIEHAETITSNKALIDINREDILAWAVAHDREYFAERQSLETRFGALKFFKGQPAMKAKSKWTVARIIARIKECGFAERFVRTSEEINKEALIEARGLKLGNKNGDFTVEDFGVKIVQEPTFTIEVKREPAGAKAMAGKAVTKESVHA